MTYPNDDVFEAKTTLARRTGKISKVVLLSIQLSHLSSLLTGGLQDYLGQTLAQTHNISLAIMPGLIFAAPIGFAGDRSGSA